MEGYADVVSAPMDYGTIGSKLAAGAYTDADAFAADVRLVSSNAIAFSPDVDDECHTAARWHLVAFEKALIKAGLAEDGSAVAAAEAAAKADSAEARRKSLGSSDRERGRADAVKQKMEEKAAEQAEKERREEALRAFERERSQARPRSHTLATRSLTHPCPRHSSPHDPK